MVKRILPLLLLASTLCLIAASTADAQSRSDRARGLRADDTFYLRARVGISTYGGDRDEESPESALFDFQVGDHFSVANLSLGLGVGYSFSPYLALEFAYQLAWYEEINKDFPFASSPGPVADLDEDDSSTIRHTPHLMLRWTPFAHWRASPFAHIGGNLSFGSVTLQNGDSESVSSVGPVAGLGLDIVATDRISVFAEITGFYTFDDEAIDLADPEVSADETDFDLLGFYGLGLAYRFKSSCSPVEVLSLDGPSRVPLGEPVTFTATVNTSATTPVDYRWDFGDGTSEMGGQTVTHTYEQPGSYTVSFTAANCGGSDTKTLTVEVYDPCPVPAEIVSISTDPSDPIFNESIRFSATVNADPPATYSWDFGDGTTSDQPSPTHRYTDPGEYTVVLEVSNCDDQTDRRELNLVVGEFRCSEIDELNTVFFDRNSAELDDEARALLDENIAILRECPEINVRLDGYASRDERRPQQLSLDRATAVEQYYIQNGISPNRLTKRGLGVDPSGGKGKGGTDRRNRRVDSIIIR